METCTFYKEVYKSSGFKNDLVGSRPQDSIHHIAFSKVP